MTKSQNIDLTIWNKEYDTKVKNLEGIFIKVEKVLDVSKYKKQFKQIQEEVNSNPNLSNEMQIDCEDSVFNDYIKKIDELTNKVEKKLLPFYELHLLSSKIDIQISEFTDKNIEEITNNTKTLIDILNSLNTYNNQQQNDLINKAYKTIYYSIIYEEVFERNDVLTYINDLNIPANKENIGRLLYDDLKTLNEETLIDEDLRAIKTEGLGYDYLNPNFIRESARKIIEQKKLEYQEKKKLAISELNMKIDEFLNKKDEVVLNLNNNKSSIRKLYINKMLLTTKVLSLVLIPFITFGAGKAIGKNSSNKITEYKTITRTIDLNTGKIIGDTKSVYDEIETTYVATVMECSPWRKNSTGVGYIRNVTAFEYIVPDNIDDNYHVEIEDLKGNTLEKYKYVESKDSLDEGDNTKDSTILITETYQDKNDNRKSTKYIIPFSIIGIGIGIIIDVLLILLRVYDFERIKEMFEDLDYEIKEYKLNNQEIKDKLNTMKEDAILLQDDYKKIEKKYGTLQDQLILSKLNNCLSKKW